MKQTIRDFKVEKLTNNTGLVRGITPREARLFFGERMYDPKNVHNFLKKDQDLIRKHLPKVDSPLYMGLGIARANLGNTVVKENVCVTETIHWTDGDEKREIKIPTKELLKLGKECGVPDILKVQNAFLLVTGGYTIEQRDNAVTIVFDRTAIDSLNTCLKVYKLPFKVNEPGKKGFVDHFSNIAIDGMPFGKCLDGDPRQNYLDNTLNTLHYFQDSGLGAILCGWAPHRVHYYFDYAVTNPFQNIVVGASMIHPFAILVDI